MQIVGQDATCGNKSVISHNSNPSAVMLPNGVVVLAYRYTFRSGSESVNIAVSQNVSGPYEAVFPCNYTMTSNTWGEDPFIFHRRDGSLHMFYHCMRYGHGLPNSPALHAWSANAGGRGRDKWHTTSSPSHHGEGKVPTSCMHLVVYPRTNSHVLIQHIGIHSNTHNHQLCFTPQGTAECICKCMHAYRHTCTLTHLRQWVFP